MPSGTRQGATPSPSQSIIASMPSGVWSATNASTALMIVRGFWLATSRKDSFTNASLGTIVLPPAPW